MKNEGFSLVEMLVTIGIAMTITAVVFFNYPAFNAGLSLRRTAEEIALTIREAQAYGLGVREFTSVNLLVGAFPGYGVHFDAATPTTFIFYADAGVEGEGAQNNQYDQGAGVGCGGADPTECLRAYTVTTGDRIVELCGDGTCDLSNLDIVFLRPHPTVTLRSVSAPSNFSKATIRVRARDGGERLITVWSTGQISIAKP